MFQAHGGRKTAPAAAGHTRTIARKYVHFKVSAADFRFASPSGYTPFEMMEEHVYTVSELNRESRELLEGRFGSVWVKGEIGELKRAASGHLYFTLKDESAEISAVRFRSRISNLPDAPLEPGIVVLAYGKPTVYEPRGRYQLVVSLIQPVGEGALQAAFERLKRRLQAEGLFDEAHKKPLPSFPERIGVITSPDGAAIRDIRSVFSRRWPLARIFLFPTTVQGEQAPEEIVRAIGRAERFSANVAPLDLLIIGRGGGSAEDLMAFNDERVARAVFACGIPTVSAVGHEIDFSITDFVADLRAPTPSAAAELVVPDRGEIIETVEGSVSRMARSLRMKLEARASSLKRSVKDHLYRLPLRRAETLEQRLDLSLAGLVQSTTQGWKRRTDRLTHLKDILRLSDPRLPMKRGYSITFLKGEKTPLRDAGRLAQGDEIMTRLLRGEVLSRIEEVNPE